MKGFRKITSVIGLAATLALAAPQAMAATRSPAKASVSSMSKSRPHKVASRAKTQVAKKVVKKKVSAHPRTKKKFPDPAVVDISQAS